MRDGRMSSQGTATAAAQVLRRRRWRISMCLKIQRPVKHIGAVCHEQCLEQRP